MRNPFQGYSNAKQQSMRGKIVFALAAVAMMMLSPIAITNESDATSIPEGVPTGPDYGFVITQDAAGANISSVEYSETPRSTSWKTLSTLGYMEGNTSKQRYSSYDADGFSEELKFDPVTGLGPFNSFYAAINVKDIPADIDTDITKFSTQAGRMAFVLNPLNLTESLSGKTFTADYYNVMLFVPTVFWYSDGTHLYLSNCIDFFEDGKYNVTKDKMVAYAHTIGGQVKPFIAIAVYESYVSDDTDPDSVLRSMAGVKPTGGKAIGQFRSWANNLNTPGMGGEYMLWNYYQWTLYKMMSYAVMGNKNSQITVGMGVVGYNNFHAKEYQIAGETAEKAPYYGDPNRADPDSMKTAVKLFIENAWGNLAEYIDDMWYEGDHLRIGQNSVGKLVAAAEGGNQGFNTNLQDAALSSHRITDSWVTGTKTDSALWDLPIASTTTAAFDNAFGDKISTIDSHNYPQRQVIVGGYSNSTGINQYSSGLNRFFASHEIGYDQWNNTARMVYAADLSTITFERGVTGDADSLGTTPDPITAFPGYHIAMPDNTHGLTNTDSHKHFWGWTDSLNYPEEGHLWDPHETMAFPVTDKTLYSFWAYPEAVTLSFDVDGGTHHMHAMTVETGEHITLPAYHGEKRGYSFIGWYNPYEEAVYHAHSQFLVPFHSVELKAVWEKHATYDDEDEDDILEILKSRSAAQGSDTGSGLNIWWLIVAVAAVAVAASSVLVTTWIKKRYLKEPAP